MSLIPLKYFLITTPFCYYFIHDGEDFGEGVGAEEGDASLLEIKQTLEDRGRRKMTTGMDDAFSLIVTTPFNRTLHVLL